MQRSEQLAGCREQHRAERSAAAISRALVFSALALAAPRVLAQAAEPATPGSAAEGGEVAATVDQQAGLVRYYKAFQGKKLVEAATASVAELRARLRAAEELSQQGRDEEAVLLLFELTQHPRFADYAELDEFMAAYYALGSSLHALGAQESARVALRHVLQKGPEGSYFAPAVRRYVDVALAGEPLAPAIAELAVFENRLPEDASNELFYLRGRERQAAADRSAARQAFAAVTRHSRFYANAQYLLGSLATEEKRWSDAEGHLCRIAGTGDDTRFSFYVDARYFKVKDLARLGLGRIAHEQRRGDDAFYYYFQVPNDSPRLPEAMFEAAYARYESGDAETALDLLDQLEARFPRSASADEASLLRGYVALSHCDFELASQHFEHFIARFEPVNAEIDRILRNPARCEALYEELSRPDGRERSGAVHRTLLALLRVDPVFSDLHDRLRKLDQESARAGKLRDAFELIAARFAGSDRPRPAGDGAGGEREELAALRAELGDARQALHALNQQQDAMRALGAKAKTLAPEEQALAELATRLRKLEGKLDDARLESLPSEAPAADGGEVPQLLARDAAAAGRFERRVLELRPQLLNSANQRAFAELSGLHERLGGFLRRARIGRIDAVMGSKRRVEAQVESLAAGRFPAELRDPLLVQGFLADDEEYWPFEGEDWPDEYLERYGDDASGAKKAKR